MPKVARVTFPASKISSQKSDNHPLTLIALFCGVGLLVSLIAVLYGVQLVGF
jgi:hypothetical protein